MWDCQRDQNDWVAMSNINLTKFTHNAVLKKLSDGMVKANVDCAIFDDINVVSGGERGGQCPPPPPPPIW